MAFGGKSADSVTFFPYNISWILFNLGLKVILEKMEPMQYEIAPLTKFQTTLHLVWLKKWAQMQIGILKPNDKKMWIRQEISIKLFL